MLSQMRKSFNRIKNLIVRGVLQSSDDSQGVQKIQAGLMADEVATDLEHPQEYGFTSRALSKAQALVIFHGGNRDNGTVITIYDKRNRPKDLEEGEVKVFTHEGTEIYLKNNGAIDITAQNSVDVHCPQNTFHGNLHVTQNITCNGDISDSVRSMSSDRTIYNSHTHPGDSGGTTGTPNQAQ